MAETYCGKRCAECGYKEALNCPGCHAGPGRYWSGECELVRCVREKGHETCETCGFRDRCGTLVCRERMPANRIKKMETERVRKEELTRRAAVLGKWLWLLFWLVVPNALAGLMATEALAQYAPGVYRVGQVLEVVCSLAWCLILMKLGSEDDRYRTAGICSLITTAGNLAMNLISGISDSVGWTLIFALPVVIVGFVGMYREFMAHADVLTGVDNDLSVKWEKLWKWYIGSLLALLGSAVLLAVIPVLGLLAVLAAAVAVIAVSILRLVYLYKTAKIFRDYCQKAE